jgi:parallel beta-helix repeat protein
MKQRKAPAPGRLRRRVRAVVAFAFAGLLVGSATMSALGDHGGGRHFSHRYPPNPVSFERPKVTGPAPTAPEANTIDLAVRLHSLGGLARMLPAGVLRRSGSGAWLLTAPVAFARRAVLESSGGRLELAPGAFLEALKGGRILLRNMTIAGVDAQGRPFRTPVPSRGFLVARDGGALLLEHDTVADLGHLGVLSYGISFRRPAAGCAVLDSTIRGNYFGIFMSHAAGVRIVGNRVVASHVYGIDPYGDSSDILIERNTVVGSGLHAIVLAAGVRRIQVRANTIVAPRAHGIVLVNDVSASTVVGNRIRDAFDGIVVTDSSGNEVAGNHIDSARRFGIRASGATRDNRIDRNTLSRALLGIYLYGGATRNSLVDNAFRANAENVRVRRDAPGNLVSPAPPLSELP